MAVKALVLDVDGVLVRAGVFADVLERDHGLDRAATSGFFHGPFKDCVLGRTDLKDAISPFLNDWGWSGSVDDCLRVWFEADSTVNDEVLGLVASVRAKGLPCYVASTQESHRAAYLEKVLGFGDAFDGLFFSCRVGACKPERAFYDHVRSTIGVEAQEVLFFDDHDPNVEGARGCGWNAELYRWGDDMRSLLSRYDVEVLDA